MEAKGSRKEWGWPQGGAAEGRCVFPFLLEVGSGGEGVGNICTDIGAVERKQGVEGRERGVERDAAAAMGRCTPSVPPSLLGSGRPLQASQPWIQDMSQKEASAKFLEAVGFCRGGKEGSDVSGMEKGGQMSGRMFCREGGKGGGSSRCLLPGSDRSTTAPRSARSFTPEQGRAMGMQGKRKGQEGSSPSSGRTHTGCSRSWGPGTRRCHRSRSEGGAGQQGSECKADQSRALGG